MTLTWIASISEQKWRQVKAKLDDNQLSLPFISGVAHNRKTGYTVTNSYYSNTSQLVIRIFHPGDPVAMEKPVKTLLDRLFETDGNVHSVTW